MSTLAESDFRRIASIAKDRWGLHLTDRKRALVSNRLASLLRKSKYQSTSEYLDHIETAGDEADMMLLFDVLSTNVTSFFREKEHFELLDQHLYRPIREGLYSPYEGRIRLWSAACSNGAEPYSMAIHAIESLQNINELDLRILATDLAASPLEQADHAVYPKKMVQHLPPELVSKHFMCGTGPNDGSVKVGQTARRLVTLGQLNLMEPWPMRGPFDAVFCRNVMIYFDKATRERLVNRIASILRPGGLLAIGSAETLSGLRTPMRPLGPSFYVKPLERTT